MPKPLPIGIDDFKEVITGNYFYIDKTLFIQELLKSKAKVTLIPRPRRFGKTLNMTMLKYFFEKSEESHRALFDDLAIAQDKKCMKHQSRYPVIFLTFKDIKSKKWEDCYEKLKRAISAEFERHRYLLQKNELTNQQQEDFKQIINRNAAQATFENALQDLSFYLQKYHNTKPIIIIDEYDTPIHAGFSYGYYDDVISFMRGLLCGGLKGNQHLAFAILTGILRVAKESIFSGINNLKVCSLLSNRHADKFGFTESEVKQLLASYKFTSKLEDVRSWYNGYRVGQRLKTPTPPSQRGKQKMTLAPQFLSVYNPWSLLNFVDEGGTFGPYWVNTSDNLVIQQLLQQASEDVKKDFELILENKTVQKYISEDITFSAVFKNTDALWSFLFFAGYLTFRNRTNLQITCEATLAAPNQEVLGCLKKLIDQWFTESSGADTYKNMLAALAQGNTPAFERYFQQHVVDNLSYFDVTQKTPERVYHAYVLGMLVGLSKTHEIKSNRESGLGCYDVYIIPHNPTHPGTIIEFKAFNKKEDPNLNAAAQSALAQIDNMQYEAELRSRGIKKIIKLAIVFEGKKVFIAVEK